MADPVARTEEQIGEDAENALIAQTLDLSDLSPASVLAVLARGAIAPELAELYLAALQHAEGYYIQTASGEQLDRRLADAGLERPAARAATGRVRFERTAGSTGDVVVAEGYTVTAVDLDGEEIEFATDAEATIADGDDAVLVPVTCSVTGTTGNVGAGAIENLTGGAVANLASVTNPNAFTPGRDRGTDDEAREVFFAFLEARARTTPAAIKYGALNYVDAAGEKPIQSVGLEEFLDAAGPDNVAARLYIMPHSGDLPDDALLAAVQQHIDGYESGGEEIEGWRAAGVKVDVAAPTLKEATIRVDLDLAPNASSVTAERLRRALEAYVAALPVGEPLRRKRIFDEIAALGSEIENANIVSPADDLAAGAGEKWIAASVTVA